MARFQGAVVRCLSTLAVVHGQVRRSTPFAYPNSLLDDIAPRSLEFVGNGTGILFDRISARTSISCFTRILAFA